MVFLLAVFDHGIAGRNYLFTQSNW